MRLTISLYSKNITTHFSFIQHKFEADPLLRIPRNILRFGNTLMNSKFYGALYLIMLHSTDCTNVEQKNYPLRFISVIKAKVDVNGI